MENYKNLKRARKSNFREPLIIMGSVGAVSGGNE